MQTHRRDQILYSRTAENNEIKNVLIDIFLLLDKIGFYEIKIVVICVALAVKSASLQQLKY